MSAAILVIDDDSSIRWVVNKALSQEGYAVTLAENSVQARQALSRQRFAAVLSDVRMPGDDGLMLLSELRQQQPQLPVIIMTAHSDLETTVAAFDAGAFDYLAKPFDLDALSQMVERAVRHQSAEPEQTPSDQQASQSLALIGESPAMQEVFRTIGRLSRSQVTVLITGASGTGKELVAQALHRHSPRADGPFVALNMAAIPKDLIESELFGHEKGAFTGANQRYLGRFEQARGGTLFLDEIGDMPLEAQTRLLRVLAENRFYRVGGSEAIAADVRVIAATHQSLEQRVKDGSFREDLFHRLNVIRLRLPTLAERPADIPLLAAHFMNKAAQELSLPGKTLLPEAMTHLQTLPWPGNVRQLENLCHWLTVMSAGRDIGLRELPADLFNSEQATGEATGQTSAPDWQQQFLQRARKAFDSGDQSYLQQAQQQFEQLLIQAALAQTDGHKQQAAQLLGWGRNTLTRKLQQSDVPS